MARPVLGGRNYQKKPPSALLDLEVTDGPKARLSRRSARLDVSAQRPFIAWDGEGIDIDGPGRRQSYVLFGASTGERVLRGEHIPTDETLNLICDVGQRNPGARHVAYAFGYDANMLLRGASESALRSVHETGRCVLRYETRRFHLEYRPGKWFRVSRVDLETGEKCTVTIEDLFSFFGSSFIAAYESLIGPVPAVVADGKAARKTFTVNELDAVDLYWRAEIGLIAELAEALRSNLWCAGLKVTSWYGPGALASYVLKQHDITSSMRASPAEVYDAARFAYAGGRFEIFQLGRIHGPGIQIFGVDINSAYPFAIAQLPDLRNGRWVRTSSPPASGTAFSVHRVRVRPGNDVSMFVAPGPLFRRDKVGGISFPWKVEGWYWAPEVFEAMQHENVEVMEGWEFVPDTTARPFAWVVDMYTQRLAWKTAGNPSQLALKLCLNSLYGKMAQRVGWNQEKMLPPKWHQLEWAGWVTSMTRAALFRVISRLKPGSLISTETDAIYTTDSSVKSLVSIGTGLGEWGLDVYDEAIYLQSGLAWLRKGDQWECKRRGLDKDSFTLESVVAFTRTLAPQTQWPAYRGVTTRFIGLGTALASSAPTHVRHCVWQTSTKDVEVGGTAGKRVHGQVVCRACRDGYTAYESAHELTVNLGAMGDRHSYRHHIPWIQDDAPIPAEPEDDGDEVIDSDRWSFVH